MGIISDVNFKLCCAHSESHQHLTFQCVVLKKIMNYVHDWLGVKSSQFQLARILLFLNRRSTKTRMQKQVLAVVITSTVYLAWWEKNELI